MSVDAGELEELLKIYYSRLFPYKPYIDWLSYNNLDYLSKREFCFTLNGDIYLRYKSFSNQDEFKKELKTVNPFKIDVGAVYNIKPKDHKSFKSGSFTAVEREVVFDIDMTDYDEVRYCCSEAKICSDCWVFMKIAVRIIDEALRHDFGFSNLLWVYSGRRGVHCWVADENARKLTNSGRGAIADYLSLVIGGDQQSKKVTLPGVPHPSIKRSVNTIARYFEELMIDSQDFLGTEEKCQKVLGMLPPKTIQDDLKDWVSSNHDSKTKWNKLKGTWSTYAGKRKLFNKDNAIYEVVLQLCYPRLDVNVTKGLNHLLKSPFSVHPKTGRVCVPFLAKDVDTFDPFIVPTLKEVITEVDNWSGDPKVLDYAKTSLKSSIDMFKSFAKKCRMEDSEENKENKMDW
ncbi:DNA primase small subunit-like [Bolinopsis microptera]|uniref:DNA primase small subunit-like n=1 Tax=Bolinopsis microptera TaxID=2820187 RepID=UPI00307A503F